MIGTPGRTLGHLVSEDPDIQEEFEETEESEPPEKSEDPEDPEKPRVGAVLAPLPEPPSLLRQLIHGQPT